MSKKKGQLSIRIWVTIILFMFIGTIAGNVESMFLSLYLNNTTFKNGTMGASLTLTDTINLIASLSSVVTCLTTFVMGTLSEKKKNRKIFISVGYIIWGIVMLFFSGVRGGNVARIFGLTKMPEIITTTAIITIVFALVLAFLRSTTSDAVFNSWVTDVSTPETSPIIETLFTIMGFVAIGIISYLVASAQLGERDYSDIFILFGVIAIVLGAFGFVLIKKPKESRGRKKAEPESSYWADLFYGFKPSAVKKNSNLYLMLSSGCLFNIACQVFMPYLFIYLGSVVIPANKGVNILSGKVLFTIIIALVIVAVGVLALMKAYAKSKVASFIPSVICFIVGLFILSSTKNIIGIIIGLIPGLIGYIIIMIQFGATVRDNIPKDKVGLFQGIRMIFLITTPSIIGPTLGNIAAKNSDVIYMENGAEKVLPTEVMFLYAAVVATLIFIPMLAFLKKDKERALKEKN